MTRRTQHGKLLVGVVRNSVGGASVVWSVPPDKALVLLANIMPQLAEAAAKEKMEGGPSPLVMLDGGAERDE